MDFNNIEYSRLVMKRTQFSGVTPTINTGSTIDNTWVDTDILNGELFYNLEDKKLYTRSGEEIVLLSQGTTGSTTTQTLSETLIAGNTTGNNWIDTEVDYGLRSDVGVNERRYTFDGDALLMFATNGTNEVEVSLSNDGYFQVRNTNETFFDQYAAPSGTTFTVRGSNAGGFKGIQYADNYAANFVDNSLVDKKYVDNVISSATTLAQVLTNGNTTGNINILSPIGYGLVSENTGTTAGYVIQSGRATMYANDGITPFPTDEAYIDVLTNGSIALQGSDSLDLNFATINVTGSGAFSGITYNADYSSNYTNRSLVDKEYVDGVLLPLSGTLTVDVSPTGSTTNFDGYRIIGKSTLDNKQLDFQHYIPKRSKRIITSTGSFVLATVPLNDSSSDFFEFKYNARKTTSPYGREVGTITAFYDSITDTVIFSRTGPLAIGDVSGFDLDVIKTGTTLELVAIVTAFFDTSNTWEFYAHTTAYASGFFE